MRKLACSASVHNLTSRTSGNDQQNFSEVSRERYTLPYKLQVSPNDVSKRPVHGLNTVFVGHDNFIPDDEVCI